MSVEKYVLAYVLAVLLALSGALPLSISVMISASLAVAFGVLEGVVKPHEVLLLMDLDLLALFVGVMIVVEVVDRCGTFRYLALKAIGRARAKPEVLLVAVGLLSAFTSLLLSDEAAALLLIAILMAAAKAGDVDPLPYAITSAVMINLGGTGTLIGSVPNMAIGLRAGFNFIEFASYLLPCEFALYGVTLALLYSYFRGKLPPLGEARLEGVEVNKLGVARGAALLALLISSLVVAGFLDLPASGVAIAIAVVALATTGFEVADVFQKLDWDTTFSIAAFTVLIEVMEKVGALEGVVEWLRVTSGGSSTFLTLLLLLASGALSILLPNLIVALSLIPAVEGVGVVDKRPLWSALVLGSNLGGVGIPVSSFVIVMVLGALRSRGYRVNPWAITRIGMPTVAVWLAFSAVYLFLRFPTLLLGG